MSAVVVPLRTFFQGAKGRSVSDHPRSNGGCFIDGDLTTSPEPSQQLPIVGRKPTKGCAGHGVSLLGTPSQMRLNLADQVLDHELDDDGLLPICKVGARPFHRHRSFAASCTTMDPGDEVAFATIRRRVSGLITDKDTNMKAVSVAAGMGDTFVRDMLKRGRVPSAEALAALARALGTSVAYLTGETSSAGDDEPLQPPALPELISVPEYDVRLSAGGGALIERENQSGVWQFSRRYLVDELRLSPANLAIVEVQGDSMEPTLRTGDRVLVDHSDRNPALPGVYAIWDSNATVVKRLERVPGSNPPKIVLISDNKYHHEYTVDAELVNVIGRVVWFARRL